MKGFSEFEINLMQRKASMCEALNLAIETKATFKLRRKLNDIIMEIEASLERVRGNV